MKRFNAFGLVVILIGLALLLNALGLEFLPEGISIWSLVWPAAILGIALSNMLSAKRVNLWSLIIALAGLYFLLVNLETIEPLPAGVFFPVALILVGIAIFIPSPHIAAARSSAQASVNSEGFVDSTAIFGGDERIITGSRFSGARIVNIFGGSNLDLTGFESTEPLCPVSVNVVFGGCTLYVPRGARVTRNGLTCAFGGIDIKGIPDVNAQSVIDLSGLVIFGGLEIRYPNRVVTG
ncbi:MAG: hypothetical protein AAGU74_09645 [Bacillota bacterium]